MSRVSRVVPWLIGAAVSVAAAPVQAQSNLDAGKSPAQIFSNTCGACHRSPRELKQTSAGFLREHYTYRRAGSRGHGGLSGLRGQRSARGPATTAAALGAGQAAPAEAAIRPPQATPPGAEQAKPAATSRNRRRRRPQARVAPRTASRWAGCRSPPRRRADPRRPLSHTAATSAPAPRPQPAEEFEE